MDSAEINPARKSSENICTNSNNRLPNTTVLDKCENREPASCSTNVSAMKCCNEITNVDKVEVVDCSSDDVSQNTRSKMRKVSFESKMETSQHDSISEETSQKLATPDISEKLSVHLRIRTSEEYQRSPRPRKVVSRSLREKGSGPLVEKLHRDKDTPTPDPSLRRSFSTQSCDKLNRSALRRGRPNTRKTGLPEPSPFKHAPSLKNETTSSNVEINRMTPMVVDKRRVEWLKGSDLFLEERKLNRSRLHFQSPSPQQKQSSLIELTKTSTESMEDVREKLLVSKLSESVFSLPSASEFQFRLQKPSFEADEETENDVSAKPLTVSRESLCSSGSCCSKNEASGTELEDDDGDDLGNLVLSEDEEEDPTGQVSVDNKNTVQEHVSLKICEYKEPEPVAKCKSVIVNDSSVDARASSDNVDVSFVSELPQNRSATTIVNKNARNSARIPEQRSSLRLSRRVSERLKRKSSSFSFPANSSVQVKTKRRLSENDVRLMSHRDVVLAPLTNDTYSILTNVGALTEASPQKEDIVASLTDSTWQPAKDALSAVRQDDVPPGGRPSLIMLKRQRAGMVSASVRKYDSISRSQCSTPKAMPSPSVRALKSPLRVPSIFVRGSSTNGSTRQQHQDLRQSIRKNDCAAKIPLTGFARRQSFNTKADGELSRSGSRSAESSPMSNETPKPSHSKPRPKSFSSPSNPIVRQSPSPLKDRNVLNRQTPRVNRVPLANTSGKVEVSSPVTNSVFKTPTSQAPQSRTRTPRSASHSTVITPGSQEKYQSPYRVVYQSFPQCQMPRVLNDSAKKLTKQMSLNKI